MPQCMSKLDKPGENLNKPKPTIHIPTELWYWTAFCNCTTLHPCYHKCGPWTGSRSIMQAAKMQSQSSPTELLNQNPHFSRIPWWFICPLNLRSPVHHHLSLAYTSGHSWTPLPLDCYALAISTFLLLKYAMYIPNIGSLSSVWNQGWVFLTFRSWLKCQLFPQHPIQMKYLSTLNYIWQCYFCGQGHGSQPWQSEWLVELVKTQIPRLLPQSSWFGWSPVDLSTVRICISNERPCYIDAVNLGPPFENHWHCLTIGYYLPWSLFAVGSSPLHPRVHSTSWESVCFFQYVIHRKYSLIFVE